MQAECSHENARQGHGIEHYTTAANSQLFCLYLTAICSLYQCANCSVSQHCYIPVATNYCSHGCMELCPCFFHTASCLKSSVIGKFGASEQTGRCCAILTVANSTVRYFLMHNSRVVKFVEECSPWNSFTKITFTVLPAESSRKYCCVYDTKNYKAHVYCNSTKDCSSATFSETCISFCSTFLHILPTVIMYNLGLNIIRPLQSNHSNSRAKCWNMSLQGRMAEMDLGALFGAEIFHMLECHVVGQLHVSKYAPPRNCTFLICERKKTSNISTLHWYNIMGHGEAICNSYCNPHMPCLTWKLSMSQHSFISLSQLS